MKCIDFDKEFERYTTAWMKAHQKDYKTYDDMEAAIPDVYDKFLDTPADFLAGEKPGEYFEKYDNAKQLVDWMEDYYKQRVPVPDMLLNRIGELGADAEDRLINLLTKERTSPDARMTAVSLLREMESAKPMNLYIEWQKTRDMDNELCDNAIDSLLQMDEQVVAPMLDALDESTDAGREALLSVLCRHTRDEKVYKHLMELFARLPERRAVLADYIGKTADERALPILKSVAASVETSYLDYIELRAAIEELGGEAPERDFDDSDPAYEALRQMQDPEAHKDCDDAH